MTVRIGFRLAILASGLLPVVAWPADRSTVGIVVLNDMADAPPTTTSPAPVPVVEALAGACGGVCPAPRVWADGEFLCWWLQKGPLKTPLVTTGDPTLSPVAGAIGAPGTRALFGGNDLDYGRTSGVRLTVGGWAGDEPFGAEVSAFFLDARDVTFAARSNALGSPPLYVPTFNLGTGNEGSVIVADPVVGFAGSVSVHSASRLWGWEANSLTAISRGQVELTLLCGFRYVDLKESLTEFNNATDLIFGTQAGMVDQFDTSNRFYGGQIGGRVTTSMGRWFLGLTYKLAVGTTEQVVDVSGVTRQSATPPVPSGTFPGAILTQPTNLGHRTSYEFSAVPELNLRAGCQVLNCLRAYVGYDVLYWSRVIRPGDEVDHGVNPSQSPIFGTGSLTGSARPAPMQNRTDFLGQGFTAGVELRY